MQIRWTHPSINDEETGEQRFLNLKSERVICPCCGGYGTTERNDIDVSKIIDNCLEDGDYEAIEAYHNGNSFRTVCRECNGNNVIDQVDWASFEANHPNEYKAFVSYCDSERADAIYAAAERRATGGY